MKQNLKNFSRVLCALAVVCCAATAAVANDRERDRDLSRVISAKAGGINHVSGDVTFKRAGATAWTPLSKSDELKSGDAVKTGADGRVEILLNPGSYLRLGHDTEFVFAETKLDKLRMQFVSGSAVIEATGYSDIDVLVTVETPDGPVELVRSGLYRFNARAGSSEVFVHSGRARVGYAIVKGGQFARISRGTPAVAKFDKKQQRDALDLWSRERAQELAKINERLQRRNVHTLLSHTRFDDLFYGAGSYGHLGLWLWSPFANCYTFLPFAYGGWPSPYGFYYGTGFGYYVGANFCAPCMHPSLRRRWDYQNNPNLGWGTDTPGGVIPITPKSTSAADWKVSAPPTTSDGSRSAGTERSVGGIGGGKGDKP